MRLALRRGATYFRSFIMKKTAIFLSALTLLTFVGCSEEPPANKTSDFLNRPTVEEDISEQIYFDGKDLVVDGPTFDLRLKKGSQGYSLHAVRNGQVLAHNPTPVRLTIGAQGEFNSIPTTEIALAYNNLYMVEDGFVASSSVTTAGGSTLVVDDRFSLVNHSINLERRTTVLSVGEGELGFSSSVVLQSNIDTNGKGDYTTCEFFIPGIYYRDNENMAISAIGASKHVRSFLAKETRTGLPMAMLREKATGATVSIAHYEPNVSTPDERNYPAAACGEEFKCGSIGVIRDPAPSVCFTYPYLETQGYAVNLGKTQRFAPLREGNVVSFTVSLFGGVYDDYNDAMVNSYEEHFVNQQKTVAEIDLDGLYDQSILDLAAVYKSHESGACGFPFASFVDTGEAMSYSYEIGFIGMQTSLAAQMIRYGLKNTHADSYNKGMSIIKFWSEQGAMPSGILRVWAWESGGFRNGSCYLRMMTDGAEGLLDAYRLLRAEGKSDSELTALRKAIYGYADFLVDKQNEDGSYYRSYDLDGNLFTPDNPYGQLEDPTTYADSKLNTPIAIRFLVRMYEQSGEEKYLNAAKKAGEFTIENICEKGKYVGGTPDNANTCDREAAIYGLYAFNALYAATGEEIYLEYAEEAAITALSWTYTFRFAVENPANLLAGKAYEQGLTDGLSLIATGHSATDTFISVAYYDLFKLYVWTGKDFFYDAALFIQNNSRQTVSMCSDLGYAYKSFAIEATDVSNGFFITAETRGVWLPWITNCNIEPVANMRQTFGVSDVESLKTQELSLLQKRLSDYGAGGNAYGYVV